MLYRVLASSYTQYSITRTPPFQTIISMFDIIGRVSKTPNSTGVKTRIIALDYLRGFFIMVIIIDHLWRWPNVFSLLSGRGELWASAAEGFVIISGLLVGYVRGYKNRNQPLTAVTKKLVGRGVLLYLWMIITSITLVLVSRTLQFKGNIAHIPIPEGDWNLLIASTLRFDYVHTLTHFLYLYAVFLVLAPVAIWLLRHKLAWALAMASAGIWVFGFTYSVEWMQWQVLFFIPTIAGYYLESILKTYRSLPLSRRKSIRYGTIATMFITVAWSAVVVLPHEPGTFEDTLFSRDPVTIATIITAFIWFIGLLSLFQLILPYLERWFGWLLLTFGERSLTAYILHAIPLIVCQFYFAQTDNIWVNSLLAVFCIVATWLLLKIPGINRIIPR